MKFQKITLCIACLSVFMIPDANAGWPPETITYKEIEGAEPLQLHVFYPDGHDKAERKPGIVLFFGGGWRQGKPGAMYVQCQYLSSRGMVAISAQYRTKSSHDVFPDSCVMDARSALRYVRENAADFGIDPQKLLAGGGSAGGHVAACTALESAPDDPQDNTSVSPRPAALVLLNPVIDVGPEGYAHDYVKNNTPDWTTIDPITQADQNFPPSIILFGTEDKIVPVATSKEFQKKLQEMGVRCDLKLYKGAGHGFFNGQFYKDSTLYQIDRFLASLGYLQGSPTVEESTKPMEFE